MDRRTIAWEGFLASVKPKQDWIISFFQEQTILWVLLTLKSGWDLSMCALWDAPFTSHDYVNLHYWLFCFLNTCSGCWDTTVQVFLSYIYCSLFKDWLLLLWEYHTWERFVCCFQISEKCCSVNSTWFLLNWVVFANWSLLRIQNLNSDMFWKICCPKQNY